MSSTVNPNGWSEYEKYVVSSLERHDRCLGELKRDTATIKESLAALRVKAGIWGAVAGIVTAAVPVMVGLAFLLLN